MSKNRVSSIDRADQSTPVNTLRMIDVDYRRSYRVRFQDTDASGFVHFSNYVRMMEETEYAFLRSHGLSIVMQDEKGVFGFPRRSTNIEVYEPATLDDQLEIWLKIDECNGVTISYQFEIARGPDVIAVGVFVLACCRFPRDELPRAILIPDVFLNRFPAPAS